MTVSIVNKPVPASRLGDIVASDSEGKVSRARSNVAALPTRRAGQLGPDERHYYGLHPGDCFSGKPH